MVMDEAFIHLCIYNYSETWKAQENRKEKEDRSIPVPVSTNAWTMTHYNYQEAKQQRLNIINLDTKVHKDSVVGLLDQWRNANI